MREKKRRVVQLKYLLFCFYFKFILAIAIHWAEFVFCNVVAHRAIQFQFLVAQLYFKSPLATWRPPRFSPVNIHSVSLKKDNLPISSRTNQRQHCKRKSLSKFLVRNVLFPYKIELKYLSRGSTFFRFCRERILKIRQLAVGCNSLYIGGNIVILAQVSFAHLTKFSVLQVPILLSIYAYRRGGSTNSHLKMNMHNHFLRLLKKKLA